MKKIKILRKFLSNMQKMRPADCWLLLFMVILMIQSAHNLFFHELAGHNISTIDVAIRTTSAAIFGYFISGAFVRPDHSADTDETNLKATPSIQTGNQSQNDTRSTARIGFTTSPTESMQQIGSANTNPTLPETKQVRRARQQIFIVGSVGLLSLLMLVFVRNQGDFTNAATAAVSQLRDFVSGSVGLLIGSSTREKR